jgi:WD40 repeat protein
MKTERGWLAGGIAFAVNVPENERVFIHDIDRGVPFEGYPRGVGLGSTSEILAVAWSPDGRYLAVGGQYGSRQNNLRVIDLLSGEVDETWPAIPVNDDITCLAFSPDSNRLALGLSTGAGDRPTTRVIDAATRSYEDWPGALVNVNVYEVAWSPDGKRLVYGSIGNSTPSMYVFDAVTRDIDSDWPLFVGEDIRVSSVEFSPDGRWLAAGRWGVPGALTVIEVTSRSIVPWPALTSAFVARSVRWSPNSKRLAVGTDIGLYVLGVQGTFATLEEGWDGKAVNVYGADWSYDGQLLACADYLSVNDSRTRVLDTGTREVYADLPYADVWPLQFAPDTRRLVRAISGRPRSQAVHFR